MFSIFCEVLLYIQKWPCYLLMAVLITLVRWTFVHEYSLMYSLIKRNSMNHGHSPQQPQMLAQDLTLHSSLQKVAFFVFGESLPHFAVHKSVDKSRTHSPRAITSIWSPATPHTHAHARTRNLVSGCVSLNRNFSVIRGASSRLSEIDLVP